MTIFKLESVVRHLASTGRVLPRQIEAMRYLDEMLVKDPEALAILQQATLIWRTPAGQPTPNKPTPAPSPSTPPASGKPTRANQVGIDIIKHFEQCHTLIGGGKVKAYRDPVGIPTIGYGHIQGVTMGMVISISEAERLLKEDMSRYEKAVREQFTVPLTQGQFNALTSFSFNLGTGAMKQSTLRRLLNQGKYDAAAREFPKWCKAGGRKLEGLERRRFAERFEFLGKDWTVFKDSRNWKNYKDM